MILWWASLQGAKVVPGDYKVRLDINGKVQEHPFQILPDPNAEVSIAQMKSQFEFISEVNATIDRAHQSIKKIRKINERLDVFIDQYKKDDRVKDLITKAEELKKSFASIEKALYQTKNRSGQDPLNFPIKLTNKLGHLNSLVGIDDFPPTDQDIAVKNELKGQIEAELNQFDNLVDKEIQDFNEAFNRLKLDYLIPE